MPRACPIGIYTNRGCVFVPEGHRKLAGGGTTGTASTQSSRPERATDQARSVAPAGARWSFQLVPVVPPPANFRRASGTKICVDTNGTSPWHLQIDYQPDRRCHSMKVRLINSNNARLISSFVVL